MNIDLLASTIAARLQPEIGPKAWGYDTLVELIVRVVLEMKNEGAL